MNTPKYTWLIAIPLTLFIQACAGPEFRTLYNYDPPKTSEGRASISQCDNTNVRCEQLEQMRVDNCLDRAELNYQYCTDQAQVDYNNSIDRCKDCGEKSRIKDDCEKEPCNRSGQCGNQYQRCYSNCGGQVTSETRCVAGCEKK